MSLLQRIWLRIPKEIMKVLFARRVERVRASRGSSNRPKMLATLALVGATFGFSQFSSADEIAQNFAEVDRVLEDVAEHARWYPPQFTSIDERARVERELRGVLPFLDLASKDAPDDPGVLSRQALANSMGHNLDFSGCFRTASVAFQRLLKIRPEDPKANYMYGAFIAMSTKAPLQSIPYLEKAIRLGESDAHYTLGFVYISQNDPEKALPEFRAFLGVHPTNADALRMVSAIESGKFRFQAVHPPVAGETSPQADGPTAR